MDQRARRYLAKRLALARPQLVAVIGEGEAARALAEDLRRRGIAPSVFVVTPTPQSGPTAPGHVPVTLPVPAELEPPEALLHALVEAMVSAYARFPVSPLTGLSCSPALQREVEDRLARGEGFAFLYFDLDNFKAYNDVYGFGRGDIAIALLGREVEAAVAQHGAAHDLAVHIGGDDFAVLTTSTSVPEMAARIIREFRRKAPLLYPEEARDRGYIETQDRQGRLVRYPLMTVSVGGVDTATSGVSGYLELAQLAAEMKAYAKSQDGGSFVMDRRRRPKASQSEAHSWNNDKGE